jgi:hypothetical protein
LSPLALWCGSAGQWRGKERMWVRQRKSRRQMEGTLYWLTLRFEEEMFGRKTNEERWKSEDGKRATGTIVKRRKVRKEGDSWEKIKKKKKRIS